MNAKIFYKYIIIVLPVLQVFLHICFRFDSINIGGFIFADQFLQISALLPSHNIYGIGEHETKLKLNTNWQSFTLFNKDQPPIENVG